MSDSSRIDGLTPHPGINQWDEEEQRRRRREHAERRRREDTPKKPKPEPGDPGAVVDDYA